MGSAPSMRAWWRCTLRSFCKVASGDSVLSASLKRLRITRCSTSAMTQMLACARMLSGSRWNTGAISISYVSTWTPRSMSAKLLVARHDLPGVHVGPVGPQQLAVHRYGTRLGGLVEMSCPCPHRPALLPFQACGLTPRSSARSSVSFGCKLLALRKVPNHVSVFQSRSTAAGHADRVVGPDGHLIPDKQATCSIKPPSS